MSIEPRETRRYLVVIRLADKEEPLAARISEHVPVIMAVLSRLSARDEQPVRAFSSPSGEFFGCLIVTDWDARSVRSQIESPGTNNPRLPAFRDKRDALPSPIRPFDQVMVLECGADFSTTTGFDAMNAWFSKPIRSLDSLFAKAPLDADALQRKVDLIQLSIDEQDSSDRDLILHITELLR